jgi:hypothetical protein
MADTKHLRTVAQLLRDYRWLTKGRIRELLFQRRKNGLDHAVVEFGRTLLIDIPKFDAWFDARFCERLGEQDAEEEHHEQ